MLVTESRPRNLRWFHAGPLLFGDWGTSRLYVLGLAFFFSAHSSVIYLAAMSFIMAAVAWCYTHICRCFPDGGGVYGSARRLSPLLSVIGATLLLCDYIVTASLSTLEAFHYFGMPEEFVVPLSITTIAALGVLNWFGARTAGRFALAIALAAMVASLAIAALCVPFFREGLATVSLESVAQSTNWERWTALVGIMLALSGVEAVSNMTGVMEHPVGRTARRTIWPVLAEVVILNLVFGVAIAGLPGLRETHVPDAVLLAQQAAPTGVEPPLPDEVRAYRDTAMKVLAEESGRQAFGGTFAEVFGSATAVIFGLLLLSATNTVIGGMVSVIYAMSRDGEAPRVGSRLNYSGVPWVGLLFATAAPSIVLLFVHDLQSLAELYAVGVVGAITINVLCCFFNKALPIGPRARWGMLAVGVLMLGVELTILATKLHAAVFAGGMVAGVLALRYVVRLRAPVAVPPVGTRREWMEVLRAAPIAPAESGPRVMLAARGQYQAEFAVDLARRRGATLFAIFVRTLRIMDVEPGKVPRVEDDPDAQEALGTVGILARQAGVPFVPIYVTSPSIADEILDYTVTFGCDTLIMGKSKRSLFARRVQGDVVQRVAGLLPDGVALVTRSADTPFEPQAGG
ncbi:MAG: universal stress protein [Phycisphaerales bacterium]